MTFDYTIEVDWKDSKYSVPLEIDPEIERTSWGKPTDVVLDFSWKVSAMPEGTEKDWADFFREVSLEVDRQHDSIMDTAHDCIRIARV